MSYLAALRSVGRFSSKSSTILSLNSRVESLLPRATRYGNGIRSFATSKTAAEKSTTKAMAFDGNKQILLAELQRKIEGLVEENEHSPFYQMAVEYSKRMKFQLKELEGKEATLTYTKETSRLVIRFSWELTEEEEMARTADNYEDEQGEGEYGEGEDLEEEGEITDEHLEKLSKELNVEYKKEKDENTFTVRPDSDITVKKGFPMVQNFPPLIPMQITITYFTPDGTEKSRWSLECTAGPEDGEPPHGFFIDSFRVTQGEPTDDAFHVSFSDLGQELQEKIYKYLEQEWGIDDPMAAFVKQWVLERRSKEGIDFLKTMKKLIGGESK